VLTPNSFQVLLSEADREKFKPIEEELVKELVDVAREHAKQEGYTFLGPVTVAIATDTSLRPGTLLVAGEMAPDQGTATLTLPDGRRIVLEESTVTMGRLPECELVIADAGVSRRHAEVRRAPDNTWVVVDLGSTNGTKVNGLRINGTRTLQNGDEITIGSTSVRFEGAASTTTSTANVGRSAES
jgi:pSer/pThr/pTyr-binding forkhead associated (FHA) protein